MKLHRTAVNIPTTGYTYASAAVNILAVRYTVHNK